MVPIEARTTRVIASRRSPSIGWDSSSQPNSAANAGSRLSRMLNTWAGTRRSAASSREYGITEASRAVSGARPSRCGSCPARTTLGAPTGSRSRPAAVIDAASPPVPGTSRPTCPLASTYPAQNSPAISAKTTPSGSRPAPPSKDCAPSSPIPPRARPTHAKSITRREVTAESTSGPRNSRATATPSGMRAIAA